ncbi:MAG: putative rane protein [Bacillales bacterium]|nr:putative rane protein [Bacillales bacterium]
MYYRIWTVTNGFILIGSIIFIWFFRQHDGTLIIISQLLAQLTVLLFIINLNMYFIFLIIRKTKKREIKIRLATISRYLMKGHIKIALFSTIFTIGHIMINIFKYGPMIGYLHIKMVMGYSSFSLLMITLIAGYQRHKKASGFRKKFHRIMAMIFTFLFLLHMFIPI